MQAHACFALAEKRDSSHNLHSPNTRRDIDCTLRIQKQMVDWIRQKVSRSRNMHYFRNMPTDSREAVVCVSV